MPGSTGGPALLATTRISSDMPQSAAQPSASGSVTPHTRPSRPRSRLGNLVVLVGLLLILIAMQSRGTPFSAELDNADAPAHFVSGLMVRDYLAGAPGSAPLQFARDYYAHYPKIAIGNWPPVFYVIEGAWLLVTPAHPGSVRVLVSLLTVVLAWAVFLVLRRDLDFAHAAFGAVLLLAMHPIASYAGTVMLENVVALAIAMAALAWARFMDRPGLRAALLFAAAAAAAVLTKGNALLLALVPPLSIAFSGRWRLLRSRPLLIAALLVVSVAGVWLWFFLGDIVSGWQRVLPTAELLAVAVRAYGLTILNALGIAGVLAALLGVATTVRHFSHADRTVWAVAAALIVAVVLFHVVVPAGAHGRHLISAYPALAMFVAAGAFALTAALRARGMPPPAATAVVLGGLGLAFMIEAARFPVPPVSGYREAVDTVLRHADDGAPTTALIVADPPGEGSFIVEMAVRDRDRPSHVVWRGGKLLALATWAGRGYRLRAEDDAGALALLDAAAIDYVIIDRTAARMPHHRQLVRIIANEPARFSLLEEVPIRRRGDAVPGAVLAVYSVTTAAARRPTLRQVPGYDGVERLVDAAPDQAGLDRFRPARLH
jgi:hypothetical protein